MSLAQPLHRGKQSVLSNPEHLRCLFQEVLGVQPRKGLSSPPRGSWLSELGLRARTEPAQELSCHSGRRPQRRLRSSALHPFSLQTLGSRGSSGCPGLLPVANLKQFTVCG